MPDVPSAMDPTRNQPPVALRIVRPYPTEDALLAAESNAFTRTGVVLIGAPSKPSGVVLRYEMCLSDGTPVMRGEGRVVGYRPADESGESALMLRFTKLDVKSKELLDRAVALREERRSLAPVPPPAPIPQSTVPPAAPLPFIPEPVAEPIATAPPPTDRDAELPEVVAEPTPAPVVDVEVAMDVDELDLKAADESDLTEQAPPVAMIRKERLPVPQPSPAHVPAPRQEPPGQPTPPRYAPEHMPAQRTPPERMPLPQSSPEPKIRADVVARALEGRDDEFRPTLDPEQRNSALERLRARKPG